MMACAWIVLVCVAIPASGQQNSVMMHVVIQNKTGAKQETGGKAKIDASDVVVWLKPLERGAAGSVPEAAAQKKWQLVQHNKSFQPHVLVVPVGAVVSFPNRDPYFHNVFSLFDGKRFDLGLYEAGATNSARFDRPGVSFLFCNIHPEMSAVVVAVDTNYFGISDHAGNITIPNVPEGKYELHVWYERSLAEDLKGLTRRVNITFSATDLGTIGVPKNPSFTAAHKNKYGQDYAPAPTPSYARP